MATSNKPLIIGIACAVVVLGVVIGIVVANSGKTDEKKESSTSQETKKNDDVKTVVVVSADDLKNVDETIAYGDFDAMKALSKAIQNGEKTGKVVKIDGIISHPGMSYSIAEQSADGTTKIGTIFTIEDGTDADYPADGAHVILTGIVRADDSGVIFTIKTLKNFVEVQE